MTKGDIGKKSIKVLNGPNLNLLGTRETGIYGSLTLQDINNQLLKRAGKHCNLSCHQSNSESELIDLIHNSIDSDLILFNPGAFTHTSIALRDAMLAINVPFIEIHLSNVYAREAFRKHSYFSDIALAVICGMGNEGYLYALDYALNYITKHTSI